MAGIGWSTVTVDDLKLILRSVEGNITIGATSDDNYSSDDAEALAQMDQEKVKLALAKMYDIATLDGSKDLILNYIVAHLACYHLYVGDAADKKLEDVTNAVLGWKKEYESILKDLKKGVMVLENATLTDYGATVVQNLEPDSDGPVAYDGPDSEKVFGVDLYDEGYSDHD